MNDEPYPLRFDVDYPEELSDTVIVLNRQGSGRPPMG